MVLVGKERRLRDSTTTRQPCRRITLCCQREPLPAIPNSATTRTFPTHFATLRMDAARRLPSISRQLLTAPEQSRPRHVSDSQARCPCRLVRCRSRSPTITATYSARTAHFIARLQTEPISE